VRLEAVREFAERTFGPLAEQKGLTFGVEVLPGTPDALVSDGLVEPLAGSAFALPGTHSPA